MINIDTVAKELFSKIRGRFPNVTIGDGEGTVVSNPAQARFFEFSFHKGNDQKVSVSLDEKEGVTVMYFKDVTENEVSQSKWFDFLKELRSFSKRRMLQFNTRDITKSNLEKRDYKYLATRSKEDKMNESKLYGTSRLSYQNIGEARIVIKHTESINQELAAGRTQKIGKIYIESADGERFMYPYRHLNGARAMARHVSEGGKPYDDFGKHITSLSEELAKLRKFKTYMGRSSVMAESLSQYMGVVLERLDSIKKNISTLQKESGYKQAFENFEQPVFEEVPDDVRENWIDELTIKQFNEELADVFPYIYKLVGEATRVKELGPEDLIGEGQDVDENTVRQLLNQFDQDANEMNAFGDVNPETVIRHLEQGDIEAAVDEVNYRYAGPDGEEPGGNFESLLAELEDDFASVVNSENDDFDYRQEYDDDPMDDMMDSVEKPGDQPARVGNEVLGQILRIVDRKQAMKVNFLDGDGMIDMYTASAIAKIYDAVNDENKRKMRSMLATSDGTRKLADFAFSKMGESIEESGLQYHIGKKKYGKDGMAKLAQAGREGASEEELGKIKDKYKTKEDIQLEQGFEEMMGQFAEGERHGNSKIYDKCWKGYRKVPGKKAGEKGSCKKIEGVELESLDSFFEGRDDSPQGDRVTTDENPLISTYDDEFKLGVPGLSGHMNLKTYMSIIGISEKYQEELAQAVLDAGVGEKISVPEDARADYDKEREAEDLPQRALWIELSQHHEKEKESDNANEDVQTTEGFVVVDMMKTKDGMKVRPMSKVFDTEEEANEFKAKNPRTRLKSVMSVDQARQQLHPDSKLEGNAYAHAVRKAKMDGKKKGDEIDGPDGKKIKLEKDDEKTPLSELILSYYDRETGEFPKGETAVLTMVEKDYGEQFIEPAKAFIEKINQTFEEFQMRTQPQQLEARTDDGGLGVVEKLLQGLTKDFVNGDDSAAQKMVDMLKKYKAPMDKVADMLEQQAEKLTKKTFGIFDNPLKKTPAGNAADRMVTLADYIRSKAGQAEEFDRMRELAGLR